MRVRRTGDTSPDKFSGKKKRGKSGKWNLNQVVTNENSGESFPPAAGGKVEAKTVPLRLASPRKGESDDSP